MFSALFLTTSLVAIFTFYLILHYLSHVLNFGNKPPGEIPLPIIGNLHQIVWRIMMTEEGKLQVYERMRRRHEKYGPILGFYTGRKLNVSVDDFDIIKGILRSGSWCGRPWNRWMSDRSWGHPYGLFFSVGDEWQEMRKFTMTGLRDFGFGKSSNHEQSIITELSELMSSLDSKLGNQGCGGGGGEIIRMNKFFTISMLNLLWYMITGKRFSHNDPELTRLSEIASASIKVSPVKVFICTEFPFLARFFNMAEVLQTLLHPFFWDLLNEARNREDYKDSQHCFVDVFLKEMDNHKGKSPNYYTDKQFITVMVDLFFAGSDTTGNTLEFGLLYLILNPHVQEKAQKEIDDVIGPTRFPSMLDRANMPYMEATILEIQRHANVVPVNIRRATEDTELGGYKLKKGTEAYLNFHSVHFSEKIWTNPQEFDPSRFLDSQQKIINAEKIMPFGGGKRICFGEATAKQTLFIYLTTMLQRYNFRQIEGEPAPSTAPVAGILLAPTPYSAHISRRGGTCCC